MRRKELTEGKRSTSAVAVSADRGPAELVRGFILSPYPTLLSRLILGLVFLVAGVAKIMDPTAFALNIAAYQMVPPNLLDLMALALPWLEVLVGLYLLIGLFLRWTALVTGALLVIFMIAMGSALARGLQLDCGCFGNVQGTAQLHDQVSWSSLVRDGLMLLLAAHLFFVPSLYSVDAFLRRRKEQALDDEANDEVEELI